MDTNRRIDQIIEQLAESLQLAQQPLTYDEIVSIKVKTFPNTYNVWDFVRFVRAVEAAHGIK